MLQKLPNLGVKTERNLSWIRREGNWEERKSLESNREAGRVEQTTDATHSSVRHPRSESHPRNPSYERLNGNPEVRTSEESTTLNSSPS